MLQRREEHPGRGRASGENRGGPCRPTGTPQHGRGAPGQGAVVVARPRQNREWHTAQNLTPAAPARQLLQYVRAGDPNEIDPREPAAQQAQRIDGEAGPEPLFDCARQNAPTIGDAARRREPLRQRRHATLRLQRIAGRNHQPDLVEPKPPQCQLGHMAVAFMRRIERAAQQADPAAPAIAEAWDRVLGERRIQRRTCPVPRTR